MGLNGSQGSGKSTLASLLTLLLARRHQLRAIDLSIDDFYLTRAARQALAQRVHPLLATRGVPGTHEVTLMQKTLQSLTRQRGQVAIPRFNKAMDDRYPMDQWDNGTAPFDLVILEGWCVGTTAQSARALLEPVNDLESREDSDGTWRRYVNQRIVEEYQPFYQSLDIWIMLQAPSFDCVYRWRLEQEEKLAQRLRAERAPDTVADRLMSPAEICRFIQHYQRLTEHTLGDLPDRVHYLFRLDEQRRVVASTQPRSVQPE